MEGLPCGTGLRLAQPADQRATEAGIVSPSDASAALAERNNWPAGSLKYASLPPGHTHPLQPTSPKKDRRGIIRNFPHQLQSLRWAILIVCAQGRQTGHAPSAQWHCPCPGSCLWHHLHVLDNCVMPAHLAMSRQPGLQKGGARNLRREEGLAPLKTPDCLVRISAVQPSAKEPPAACTRRRSPSTSALSDWPLQRCSALLCLPCGS